MKRKSGLILLLVALLVGTCTAYATGEIERYQRDKLKSLTSVPMRQLDLVMSSYNRCIKVDGSFRIGGPVVFICGPRLANLGLVRGQWHSVK